MGDQAFLKFDRQQLKYEVSTLTRPQRIAFLLSIAERAFPYYVSFHRERSWGEPRLLREALDTAWATLAGRAGNVDLQRIAEEILAVCPDTEKFEGSLVGMALGACSTAVYLLRFIQNDKVDEVLEAAQAAADAADGHAGWVLFPEHVGEDTHEMWQQQLEHPITQGELRSQRDALSVVRQRGPVSEKTIEEFKKNWMVRDGVVF